jgi:hypothetical protein
MPQPDATQATEQSIEYSIYVHHHPASQKTPESEMVGDTSTNMKEVMKKAEDLHASGKYHKVEIKQKYFDPKNNRKIDMTLKILEGRAKKPVSLLLIIFLAVSCGVGAFGLTLYLVGIKPVPAAADTAAAAPSPESPPGQ